MIGWHLHVSYHGYATRRKSCDGLSEGYVIGMEWVTQLKPLKEQNNQSEVAKFDYRCSVVTR